MTPNSYRTAFLREDYLRERSYLHKTFCESDPDPEINFRLTPNKTGIFSDKEFSTTVRINSHGFRGDEWPTSLQLNRKIMVLGDSMTFGWGIEETETFISLLRRSLSNGYIYNLGVPAYNTKNEYKTLVRWGPKLKPTDVLLVFYQNDIIGMGDPPFKNFQWPTPQTGPNSLYLVRFFIKNVTELLLSDNKKTPYYKNISSRSWNKCKQYLVATTEWCKEKNVNYYMCYIPCRDELREKNIIGARHFIREFATEKSIQFLDMTEIFQTDNHAQYIYFHLDDHLTPYGHNLLSQYLAKLLSIEK